MDVVHPLAQALAVMLLTTDAVQMVGALIALEFALLAMDRMPELHHSRGGRRLTLQDTLGHG